MSIYYLALVVKYNSEPAEIWNLPNDRTLVNEPVRVIFYEVANILSVLIGRKSINIFIAFGTSDVFKAFMVCGEERDNEWRQIIM